MLKLSTQKQICPQNTHCHFHKGLYMHYFKKILLILCGCTSILQVTAEPNLNNVPLCNPNLAEGQKCYLNSLTILKSGQFNFGEQYVNGWVDKYKNMPIESYQQILDKQSFPIIVAPNQQMFLADGHHRLRATAKMAELQHHTYRIYLQIFKKFPQNNSLQAENSFWQWMYQSKNIWLIDEGVSRNRQYLPTSILKTTNDKYRTLTGWLMEAGWCYDAKYESSVNYIEFYWSDYFRNLAKNGKIKAYTDPNPTTTKGLKDEYEYLNYIKSTGLCHAPAANGLPGYCKTDHCS